MGLIIDIVVTLFALGLLVVVVPIAYRYTEKRRLKDPKQRVFQRAASDRGQGEVNHLVAKYDLTRLCTECEKMTNVKTDLCLDGEWIHSSCYMKLVTGKKDNS